MQLDNCIAGRSLRKFNQLRSCGREAGLTEDQQKAQRIALTQPHDDHRTRAVKIRTVLNGDRDAANDAIRQQREGAEAGAEAPG